MLDNGRSKVRDMWEDVLSLITIRLFAKWKKRMISKDDFETLAMFGAGTALQVISVSSRREHLREMVDEELRKACELISNQSCGRCKGRGVAAKQGDRYIICKCVNMVHYRGDKVLPNGEQYSNQYFVGEFSKTILGSKKLVTNIAAAIQLFIMPRGGPSSSTIIRA